jgi:hypothetical protein
MSNLKLACTDRRSCVMFLAAHYKDVDEAMCAGIDRALALVMDSADVQDWVSRILETAADAPDAEIPGLTEALGALLSTEERPAAELIAARRGR